jgi:RNA polymerase sigma-70 factor (ECF subfamily)
MPDAPPLAERSAEMPPGTGADFESFYLAHRVNLFRALVVVTRDVHAAEEVAQDAFVRVWERWDRVRHMEDPTGYLYRTALNGWFQIRRRAVQAARRVAGVGRVLDPLGVVEDRDALARRLLDLPSRQRAALVLTEYLGHARRRPAARSASGLERSDGWPRKAGPRSAAATRRRDRRYERRTGGDRTSGGAV